MSKAKQIEVVRGVEGDGWRYEAGEVVKRTELVKAATAAVVDHWINRGVLKEVVTDGDG